MLSPVLDEVTSEVGDTAKIGKVDAATEQELAQKFGVTMVPALIFLKDGKEVDRGGMMSKADMLSKLQGI